MPSATFLAPNKAASGDSLFTTVSRYSAALGIILPSGLAGPFEQQGPRGGYFSSGALKPAGVRVSWSRPSVCPIVGIVLPRRDPSSARRRRSSGNKIRDKTVFHTPPRNTTKPQVKSGAFEKSAHHFSTLENAPFQIICSGICSAPGLPKGDSCTRGLCASSRQDDVAVLVVQRHLAPNTLPLSVE